MKNVVKAAGATTLGIAVVFTFAACSSGSSSSSSSGKPTWKIGLEAPLTGDQATLGQGMLQGAQLAADQINSAGGMLGKDIEIVQIDDAADPETGVTAANAAIASGLNGVVGPYNSGVGQKTLPLYLKAGVVPIRLTSDNSTDGMGYTLQPMTNQIAPVAAEALTKFFKAKTVGIIYDSAPGYTVSTASAVKKDLEAAGATVTSYQPITAGESSYSSQLAAVEAKKPNMIYSVVYYPEGAKIAQELTPTKAGGTDYRCLLDYASYDNGYIQNAGADAARCDVVGVPAPSDFEGSEKYTSAFQSQFNAAPGTWSPYTYDSVNFLVDGAKATGGFTAATLNPYLSTVKGWTGWTGTVNIEPKTGNRSPATVVVTEVTDGAFHVDSAWAKAVGAPY